MKECLEHNITLCALFTQGNSFLVRSDCETRCCLRVEVSKQQTVPEFIRTENKCYVKNIALSNIFVCVCVRVGSSVFFGITDLSWHLKYTQKQSKAVKHCRCSCDSCMRVINVLLCSLQYAITINNRMAFGIHWGVLLLFRSWRFGVQQLSRYVSMTCTLNVLFLLQKQTPAVFCLAFFKLQCRFYNTNSQCICLSGDLFLIFNSKSNNHPQYCLGLLTAPELNIQT